MDYYTELDMKRNLYNASHNKKANKVIIGWKIEEYLMKMASSCYSDIDIRLQWNKETEEYELSNGSNHLIIPIATTGGSARQIWDELNKTEKYNKNQLFQSLDKETDANNIVKTVIELIEEKKED